MTVISSRPVSARVLDAAIAWQLSLDSGDGSAIEREEFDKWLASDEEHARAWRQLGMLDQRFSVASGPARAALLQSREGIRQRVRKLGSGHWLRRCGECFVKAELVAQMHHARGNGSFKLAEKQERKEF